jgi:hypothetical protein
MFSQYGPLAAAIFLLTSGAFQAKDAGGSDGIILGTAGLIVLGSWLAITIYTIVTDSKARKVDEDYYESEEDGD